MPTTDSTILPATVASGQSRPFDPNEHMIKLQGRDYLEVKFRLVWFRQDHPDGIIVTDLVEHDRTNKYAVVRAHITIPGGGLATAYSLTEPTRVATDYIANAETSAIGRALAHLGYGTQFAPEMDQGDTLADSPVQRQQPRQQQPAPQRPLQQAPPPAEPAKPAGPRLSNEQVGRFITAATAKGEYTPDQVRHAVHAILGRPVHEMTKDEAIDVLLPAFQQALVKRHEETGRWFIEVVPDEGEPAEDGGDRRDAGEER